MHSSCTCIKQFKIPKLELAYIRDQRLKVGTKGMFQMGKVEESESAKQIKAMKRKYNENSAQNPNQPNQEKNSSSESEGDGVLEDKVEDTNNDVDWGKFDQRLEKQNRVKLTETVKAGMRFGMSSRGMATLATWPLSTRMIPTS